MRDVSLTVMAAIVALSASPSHAADGWRGYRFGMGRDEARALPGISWEADEEVVPNFIVVNSAAPVQVDGKSYDVSLSFSPASHLHQIAFAHRLPAAAAAICRVEFETQLAQLERTYGPFLPETPGRNEKTLETKQLPTIYSSYATLVKDVSGTIAAKVFGSFVKLSAYRNMGTYTVFTDTVWTTKNQKCSSVRYRLLEH